MSKPLPVDFYYVENSYPGLQSRYEVGVMPGRGATDAIGMAKALDISPGSKGMVFHARLATNKEIVTFLDKAKGLIAQAKGLKVLIPYFDAHFS